MSPDAVLLALCIAAGLAKAANDLSDTCTACHSVYKKQS
jgi:hypothetical protein